jgi:hypothetical protein
MSKLTQDQKIQIATDESTTKTQRILFLHKVGCDRSEIATLIGIRTQFVYNVLDRNNLIVKGVAKCDINDKYGHLLQEDKKTKEDKKDQ